MPEYTTRTMTCTTYLAEDDITVVWQLLFLNDEPVQRALTGWYYGRPDEKLTKEYSKMPLIAQF